MELEAKGGAGQCQWTSSQSYFMLSFLANVVSDGTRTSSGFKKVHLNACAKALSEFFKIQRSGDQIANHLKTWRKKYTKINQLRKISGAIWDEDHFIISLDHDHYTSYMEDNKNKGDDEYLNKPLKYYGDLSTIYGSAVATGQYAKSSSEPLATEGFGNEGNNMIDNSAVDENVTTSSSGRSAKKARITESDADSLISAFEHSFERLATAMMESATVDKTLPVGLFATVDSIPGFELLHKSLYYAHLVKNPNEARAFMELPLDYKLTWITKFV